MTIAETSSRGIVVTGSGGISESCARRLLTGGHRVHLVGLTPQDCGLVKDGAAGLSCSAHDLSDDRQAAEGFAEAAAALGRIDGLVAVAGGSARRLGDGPVDQLTTTSLHANVDLNLATTVTALREFLSAEPEGRRHRAAVLIGSTLAWYPATPLFVTHGYAAMKAALVGLSRAAAAHYSSRGVTVNVVSAGLVRSPMSQRAQQTPAIVEYARQRQPLTDDGFLIPDDIAAACEYLLSAPRVTGQVLHVDGGWSVFG